GTAMHDGVEDDFGFPAVDPLVVAEGGADRAATVSRMAAGAVHVLVELLAFGEIVSGGFEAGGTRGWRLESTGLGGRPRGNGRVGHCLCGLRVGGRDSESSLLS